MPNLVTMNCKTHGDYRTLKMCVRLSLGCPTCNEEKISVEREAYLRKHGCQHDLVTIYVSRPHDKSKERHEVCELCGEVVYLFRDGSAIKSYDDNGICYRNSSTLQTKRQVNVKWLEELRGREMAVDFDMLRPADEIY